MSIYEIIFRVIFSIGCFVIILFAVGVINHWINYIRRKDLLEETKKSYIKKYGSRLADDIEHDDDAHHA